MVPPVEVNAPSSPGGFDIVFVGHTVDFSTHRDCAITITFCTGVASCALCAAERKRLQTRVSISNASGGTFITDPRWEGREGEKMQQRINYEKNKRISLT